jgi:hypothetical protein
VHLNLQGDMTSKHFLEFCGERQWASLDRTVYFSYIYIYYSRKIFIIIIIIIINIIICLVAVDTAQK